MFTLINFGICVYLQTKLFSPEGAYDEKFESLTLEYTYLLTKQLESQRQFFEEKLSFVEVEASERVHALEEEVTILI